MKLNHREDDSRRATLTKEKGPVLRLEYTDDAAKSRKKIFKNTGKQKKLALDNVWRSALRFLFQKGFVAPAPQKGPLSWLCFTDEESPGGEPFALDEAGQFVWVGDSGFLRRIGRGSCEQLDISLGHENARIREVKCDANGAAYALVVLSSIPVKARPKWSRPSEGPFAFEIIRTNADSSFERIANVGYSSADHILMSLSVAGNGDFLGPHAEGAGLYNSDVELVEKYPVGAGKSGYPTGGLSPNGRWIALTQEGGQVRVLGLDAGYDVVRKVSFSEITRIEISDKGRVHIYGHGPEQWGIYRLNKSSLVRISDNIHGQPTSDGRRVLEIGGPGYEGWAFLRKNGEAKPIAKSKLPMLVGRYGRTLFWGDGKAVIRTRGNILAELDLSKLGKPGKA